MLQNCNFSKISLCHLYFLQKIRAKSSVFCPFFCLFSTLKPQYIVVKTYFLPSKPQDVIRITVSTCLVAVILMTIEPATPLAAGYFSQKQIKVFHYASHANFSI